MSDNQVSDLSLMILGLGFFTLIGWCWWLNTKHPEQQTCVYCAEDNSYAPSLDKCKGVKGEIE